MWCEPGINLTPHIFVEVAVSEILNMTKRRKKKARIGDLKISKLKGSEFNHVIFNPL